MNSNSFEATESTSLHKGVYWNREKRKWDAYLHSNGKNTYGGRFKDELDAAKRVNQLCKEFKIPLRNPGISALPTQPYQVIQFFFNTRL